MSSSPQCPPLFPSLAEAVFPQGSSDEWMRYINHDLVESDGSSNCDSYYDNADLPWTPASDLQPESPPFMPPSGSSGSDCSLSHALHEHLIIAPHLTTSHIDFELASSSSTCSSYFSSTHFALPSLPWGPIAPPMPRCPSALSEASSSSSSSVSSSSTFSSTFSRPSTPASPFLTPTPTSASPRRKTRKQSSAASPRRKTRKQSSAARVASAGKSHVLLRKNQSARNVQLDIKEKDIKGIKSHGACPFCDKTPNRPQDFVRHVKTHIPSGLACVGATVEEADRMGIPPEQRINPIILDKKEMVGGCLRTFSRDDSFMRGHRRDHGCLGAHPQVRPQLLYAEGLREVEEARQLKAKQLKSIPH